MDSVQYASNCVIKILTSKCRRLIQIHDRGCTFVCVRREILSYFNSFEIIFKLLHLDFSMPNYYYRELKRKIDPINIYNIAE